MSATRYFRVLALSASPGSDVKSVQNCISNLLISHMEIRSDGDDDVHQFTHNTELETIVLPLSSQMLGKF